MLIFWYPTWTFHIAISRSQKYHRAQLILSLQVTQVAQNHASAIICDQHIGRFHLHHAPGEHEHGKICKIPSELLGTQSIRLRWMYVKSWNKCLRLFPSDVAMNNAELVEKP